MYTLNMSKKNKRRHLEAFLALGVGVGWGVVLKGPCAPEVDHPGRTHFQRTSC